ncbi:MAG: LPXTG cell wall anchor domain-containing protein [DPANN group archaeon]|nr:LPXTG cell wall anchor domain-containing protein [DPANN group archaeon]
MGKRACSPSLSFILSSLLFILLAVSSVSGATELYSGWVYHGDTISAGGKTIRVQFPDGAESFPDRIVLRWNSFALILGQGDCDEKDDMILCYVSSAKAVPLEDQFTRWKAEVTIEQHASQVSLSRTIDPLSVILGEKIEVTTLLSNDGDADTTDGIFTDPYPADQFFITLLSGDCTVSDNTVHWAGDLTLSLQKECKYALTTKKPGTYASGATFSYDERGTGKSVSDTKTLTVKEPALTIKTSLNSTRVKLDETFDLNVTLTNTNPDLPVDVNAFEVTVPSGLAIERNTGFLYRDDGRLVFNGRIEPDAKQSFQMTVQGIFTGQYVLDLSLQYRESSFIREASSSVFVQVFMDRPNIRIVTDKARYAPGEPVTYTINITNPSRLFSLFNIHAEITSPIPGMGMLPVQMSELGPGETVQLHRERFPAPDVSLPINATIWYENDRGERKTFHKGLTVLIMGQQGQAMEDTDGNVVDNSSAATDAGEQDAGPRDAEKVSVQEVMGPLGTFVSNNLPVLGISLAGLALLLLVGFFVRRKKKNALYEEASARIKAEFSQKETKEEKTH